jgi:hypothetical protein
MILDTLTELSSAQDIHAASCASTNSYNFGTRANYDDAWNSHPGNPNPGRGNPVRVLFTVTTAAAAGDAAKTLTVALQDSTDDSTFADTTAKTGTITGATLVAGYQWEMFLPDTVRQYMQAYYTLSAAFTSLAIQCDMVVDAQTNRSW